METDENTTILVTGAAGRQGASGRAVVERLLSKGRRVRAMVRTRDERASVLEKAGAEIVVGDFADYASLCSAVEGVRSAYFCHPVGPGITEAAGLFAAAGREKGLSHVVDLSLAAARPDSPSPQGRAQWVAEQIFDWAGLAATHLRIAAFFMENIALLDGPGIRKRGRIANSFGALSLPWISGVDVGNIAASLLLAGPQPADRRLVVAGGVERLNYGQIADVIARQIGRAVQYEELTPDAWHRELVAASTAKGEPNIRGADHLTAQSIALRKNPIPALPDRVEELTGQAAIGFSQFIKMRLTDFSGTA
jgi:uncharacterized protein YbjT (DUF2867 family)